MKRISAALLSIGLVLFGLSGCSKSGNTAYSLKNDAASVVSDENDLHEEITDDSIDGASKQKEKSVEKDPVETKEDAVEPDQIDVDLREKLITEGNLNDDRILLFRQEDFDDDGINEAFALVMWDDAKEYDDEEAIEGDVWFVSPKECQKLLTSEGMGIGKTDRIFKFGNKRYELFDDTYATGSLTYAWYVDGGEVKDAPFSKIGTVITDVRDEDSFAILDSSYDALYDPEVDGTMGHTWKQYYFFYDENNDKICEYGGKDIDRSTAKDLCGMDLVGDCLPSGDKLTSLFYKGNGLVAMNYEHEEEGYINYYHLLYDYKKRTFLNDFGEETGTEPLAGIYSKALCPDMAVYPED